MERYLADGFTYNENPALTRYPLETFLFASRVGYCQQFSGAMALLLRMGGVPARVAAGFTSGTYDRSSHQWVVTDRDAHAWVEAWFPKYGWVRFDPTPVSAPARGGSTAAPITKPVGVLPGDRDPGAAARRRRSERHPGDRTRHIRRRVRLVWRGGGGRARRSALAGRAAVADARPATRPGGSGGRAGAGAGPDPPPAPRRA